MQAVEFATLTGICYDGNKPIYHYLVEHEREQEHSIVGRKEAGLIE